jgi:hypothetical protein
MNHRTKLHRGQQVSSWAFGHGTIRRTHWNEGVGMFRYLVDFYQPGSGKLTGWFDGDELIVK